MTNFFTSVTNTCNAAAKNSFSILISLTLLSHVVTAQTIDIGPNQYAFRYSANPNFGLYFNADDIQYEFRDGSANSVFSINANNGYLKNNLRFADSADYMVPTNRYAFRAAANHNYGLFFSSTEFEFRDGAAEAKLRINANSGNLTTTGNIAAGGQISVPGGSSNQWNEAFGWGNHATQGYLTTEADPKVGTLDTDNIPRWDGASLVSGSINDLGDRVNISVPATFDFGVGNSATTANGLRIGSELGTHLGMDGDEIQAYNSGNSDATLNVNPWNGDINLGNNVMRILNGSARRVGLNTSYPTSKLDVQGETGTNEIIVNVQTNANVQSDVRGINVTSMPHAGFGYGVHATGGFRAVYAYGNGSNFEGTTTGVYGYAAGSAGTRIGIYGYATGGNTNWAGYFNGDVNITGTTFLALQGQEEAVPEGYALAVGGKILGEELKIQLTRDWPDYVFDESYDLMPLDNLGSFISENNHLPGMPSATDIEADNGIEVGEMQRLTVEKLEELALYILELKSEKADLGREVDDLKNKLTSLTKRLDKLEKRQAP